MGKLEKISSYFSRAAISASSTARSQASSVCRWIRARALHAQEMSTSTDVTIIFLPARAEDTLAALVPGEVRLILDLGMVARADCPAASSDRLIAWTPNAWMLRSRLAATFSTADTKSRGYHPHIFFRPSRAIQFSHGCCGCWWTLRLDQRRLVGKVGAKWFPGFPIYSKCPE